MSNEFPAITVVINTYNRPQFLPRALQSVLTQTYHDFEVILIHDGPADDVTVTVAETYDTLFWEANIPYRFITLEENSGYQCVPKNVGIWHSRGDYIAYLDDDNEWTPTHLEVLITAMEAGDRWPDFTYGRRNYINDTDRDDLATGPSSLVEWDSSSAARLAQGPMANFIDTSDCLIAKGSLWHLHLKTGHMWNTGVRRFGDWELFFRGSNYATWRGKAVDKIVQNYYWHGDNLQLTRPAVEGVKGVTIDVLEEVAGGK